MSTTDQGKRQVTKPEPDPVRPAGFARGPRPAASRTPAVAPAPPGAAPTSAEVEAPTPAPSTAGSPRGGVDPAPATAPKPAAKKRATVQRDKVQVSVWVPDYVMDQVAQLKSYLKMDSAHVVMRALSESPDKLREAIALERQSRLPDGVPEPTASPFAVDEPARMSRRVVKGGRAQLGFYLAPANLEVLDQLVETVGANARPELLTASISALYRACNLG